MNSGGFFGKPFASGAAPSGGLFFGENDGECSARKWSYKSGASRSRRR